LVLAPEEIGRPLEDSHISMGSRLTQMDAKKLTFKHQELTRKIIGVFYEVYNELGHGFLESVYEAAMLIASREAGLKAETQVPIAVYFRGNRVGDFRADLMVENAVLLELKAARALDSSHEAQLLNYLRATQIEVGLLLNFGIKPEFKRLAFDNERKKIPGQQNPAPDQGR
jgi:GxxExxY protein